MLLFNDCGVIELDIAQNIFSIRRFSHIQLLMKGGSEPPRVGRMGYVVLELAGQLFELVKEKDCSKVHPGCPGYHRPAQMCCK